MKPLILAGLMSLIGTACFADDLYWVIGNRATSNCEIVTSNPVITGDIWFGWGRYTSLHDAELARSIIRGC